MSFILKIECASHGCFHEAQANIRIEKSQLMCENLYGPTLSVCFSNDNLLDLVALNIIDEQKVKVKNTPDLTASDFSVQMPLQNKSRCKIAIFPS